MAKQKTIKSPTQIELIVPTFEALVALGGSATVDEIREQVIKALSLSDEIVDEPHKGKATQQTELEYQLAWARTRLKSYGAIINSSRGVWMITTAFSDKSTISRNEVVEFNKKEKASRISANKASVQPDTVDLESTGNQPRDKTDNGGFTRAVFAHEAVNVALGNVHIHVFQRPMFFVALGKVDGF